MPDCEVVLKDRGASRRHAQVRTRDAAIRAGADVNVLARMSEDTRAGVARFLEEMS